MLASSTLRPFEEYLNYSAFSITVKPGEMEALEEMLLDVSEEEVAQMQRNLAHVQHMFFYDTSHLKRDYAVDYALDGSGGNGLARGGSGPGSARVDAVDMILISVQERLEAGMGMWERWQ
jgi:hypothetical protein